MYQSLYKNLKRIWQIFNLLNSQNKFFQARILCFLPLKKSRILAHAYYNTQNQSMRWLIVRVIKIVTVINMLQLNTSLSCPLLSMLPSPTGSIHSSLFMENFLSGFNLCSIIYFCCSINYMKFSKEGNAQCKKW